MAKAPCMNCEDRKVGCHSKCRKYIDFKAERALQQSSEQRAKEIAWTGFRKQQDMKVRKIMKSKGIKRKG